MLGVSPVLLERYLSAAGKISALAVGDPGHRSPAARRSASARTRSQDRHVDGLPIGTVGGMLARIDAAARRRVRHPAELFRTNLGAMRGLEYPHQLEITVDGARVHLAAFGGDDGLQGAR